MTAYGRFKYPRSFFSRYCVETRPAGEDVEELVEMIEAQRAYEINSKMVSAVDEMLRNANQTL